MKRSSLLSLAALSAALLLSFSASAHDPKEFDRMFDAAPASTEATACAKLEALRHGKAKPTAAEVKSLRARCEADNKAASKPSARATVPVKK
ncbi:MAG: hypothetical protein ACYC42_00480 [Lysobacter sp.]